MSSSEWQKPPNVVSLFRGAIGVLLAILGIAGAIRLAFHHPLPEIQLVWFQIAIIVGAFSDKLDGVLARKFDWETSLGKKLERNMDGFFILSAVLFETVYLNLPLFLLLFSGVLVVIGTCFILVGRLIHKRWFIDDYVSIKLAPGFAYLMLILHTFPVPFVRWLDYAALLVGMFALIDFLHRFNRWHLKQKQAPSPTASVRPGA